jgi:hypothetical protein
MSDLVG